MRNTMERLAASEKITDWLGITDDRLVRATDEPSPNGGLHVRESWDGHLPKAMLVAHVSRLLVPGTVELDGPITAELAADEWRGATRRRVHVNFGSEDDWLKCFPLGDQSRLPTSDEDWHAWAGMAVCGEVMGLAVMASEWHGEGIQARVQPVPDKVFSRILEVM